MLLLLLRLLKQKLLSKVVNEQLLLDSKWSILKRALGHHQSSLRLRLLKVRRLLFVLLGDGRCDRKRRSSLARRRWGHVAAAAFTLAHRFFEDRAGRGRAI